MNVKEYQEELARLEKKRDSQEVALKHELDIYREWASMYNYCEGLRKYIDRFMDADDELDKFKGRENWKLVEPIKDE